MSNPRKVVLFGGQGSQHLFSPQSASTAIADARSSSAAAILLSRCHAVFLEDLRTIGSAKSKVFGDHSKLFVSPESLLCPDATFHDSPIIQSTTIALQQLLRYLSYATQSASSYADLWDQIQEAAGFCSGILPAAVVCASSSVEDYIEHAVQVFRLALWTGYRSAVYCEQLLGRPWKDLPWSLVTFGLDKDEVSARLENFKNQVSLRVPLHPSCGIANRAVHCSTPVYLMNQIRPSDLRGTSCHCCFFLQLSSIICKLCFLTLP